MIYISVDNDHHSELALLLIEKYQFSTENVIFISHQSKRNTAISNSKFERQAVTGHPLSSGTGYKNPMSYLRSIPHQRKLNRIFNFKKEDMLIIITEYQLNNALLAKKMMYAGGRVYLFDEGIGFYFNNSSFNVPRTTLMDHIFLFLYNIAFQVLRIPAYAKKGFEGRMHVRIEDKYVNYICSRMRLPIDRKIPILGYRNFLSTELASALKKDKEIIFFANNLEAFNLKFEELDLSKLAIKQMAFNFDKVYIKIHPGDWVARNDVYDFYIRLANQYENISIIDNSISGNDAIRKIKPTIIVGTLGAVIFDGFFFGCQPIFLFQLLPRVDNFDVCDFTLKNMNYNYINSIDEITPNYQSGVNAATLIYADEQIWNIN